MIRIIASTLVLLGCTLQSATAQGNLPNRFVGRFTVEKKCYRQQSDCNLRVAIQCTYINLEGNVDSCLDTNLTTNRSFLSISKEECSIRRSVPAKIRYRVCNDNDAPFKPIKSKNDIRFRRERSVKPDNWDNQIAARSCREHQITENIDLCKATRVVDNEFDGIIVGQAQPNYCRCYLYKESNLDIYTPSPVARRTSPPTKRPTFSPRTRSPTRNPTKYPTFSPTRNPTKYPTRNPTKYPTQAPTRNPCNLYSVIITELASPYNYPNGRYIELFFGSQCGKYKIPRDIVVVRWPKGQQNPSPVTIPLKDVTIPDDGFLVICASYAANNIYGFGTCDMAPGFRTPADVEGTDTIAVVDKLPTGNLRIIDIFGYPRRPNPDGSNQDFTGGRAVRKLPFKQPSNPWNPNQWYVLPGRLTPEDCDPGEWNDVVLPPPVDRHLIITEIVDTPDSSGLPPRFVEIYAPRLSDRVPLFNENFSLVIYEGNSLSPNWNSAVPIYQVNNKGFFVVCNPAAAGVHVNLCDIVDANPESPANSDGDDQIAIVRGNRNNYKIIDIFGRIGEDGDDFLDHNFSNARALRKLNVTEPKDNWSPYDWHIIRPPTTIVPDPQEWKEIETPLDPCDFFFTEFSDPLDNETAAFIEIKATCPGRRIPSDIYVVTYKSPVQRENLSQIGTVPDDGFIIICKNRAVFEARYNKVCDIESPEVQPDGLYTVELLDDNGTLDVYGIIGFPLPPILVFKDGRAFRDIDAPTSSRYCIPQYWHVVPGKDRGNASTGDMDPREWQEERLVLYFTEFADPSDDDARRFFELYSPNRRNYLIQENLYIFKHDPVTNAVFGNLNLKGMRIDGNGFLVICVAYWSNRCTTTTGDRSIVYSPGTYAFTLQSCEDLPSGKCDRIDSYGVGCFTDGHSYENGRAVRRKDAQPKPSFEFYLSHWIIIPGAGSGQVPSDGTDPGEWNDENDRNEPAPSPSSPSTPSKGVPAKGVPSKGAPSKGAPSKGAPSGPKRRRL